MLNQTRARLDLLYTGAPQTGGDGDLYPIKPFTKISPQQGELLAALHRQTRPDLSIEVGLAYGFSTLFILDSMHELGYGRHIAIDPFQAEAWHGIGLRAVADLGFDGRFEWLNALSYAALGELHGQGRRAQYVYIDGNHTFDACFIDFMLTDQLLDVGGVVILDDLWMPSIRKVASFIKANLAHYSEIGTACENAFCVRKTGPDTRDWSHFRNFSLIPVSAKRLRTKVYNFIKRV